jgi:hypothetical protein
MATKRHRAASTGDAVGVQLAPETKRQQAEREMHAKRAQKMLDQMLTPDQWAAMAPRSQAQIEEYDRVFTTVAKWADEGYVSTARFTQAKAPATKNAATKKPQKSEKRKRSS